MGTQSKETNNNKIKLSIQVSLNGLSFCAFIPAEQKIIFLKDINFTRKLNPAEVLQKIEKLYDEEEFLKKESPEVTVQFSNELYTLVPEKFFNENNASDFLKFNTSILETDYVAHDIIGDSGIINVYIPYTNINNFFFEKYGEFEYRHCITTLAENLLKHKNDNTRVYVNCYTRGYDLIVIKNGNLILANSFTCQTKEDFLYYILFTAEQLELDPSEFELFLLGKITADSDYYQIAYRYIKNIRFLETAFGYIFTGKKPAPRGYMYYTLLKVLK